MSILAISILVLGQGGVPAQQATVPIKMPRYDYRIQPFPGTWLISWEPVQREVGLSADLREKMEKSMGLRMEMIGKEPRNFDPNADPVLLAMNEAVTHLNEAQKKRLGEIYMQYYDVNALADPTVASRVGLSRDQQKWVNQKLTDANNKFVDAQEAMFERFRTDNLEIQKNLPPRRPGEPLRYTIPREIQNQHTDLTRRTRLVQAVEMANARAEIRAELSPAQMAKLEAMKGRRIDYSFYDLSASAGSSQPHPELAESVEIQAELGMTLKEYQTYLKAKRTNPKAGGEFMRNYIAKLPAKEKAKLRQYDLQYDREYTVLRHSVTKELGLSAGQVDSIMVELESLYVESRQKADRIWERPDGNSQSAHEERGLILARCDELQRQAILDALSPAQKRKWIQMQGPIIKEIQPSRSFG